MHTCTRAYNKCFHVSEIANSGPIHFENILLSKKIFKILYYFYSYIRSGLFYLYIYIIKREYYSYFIKLMMFS